MRAEDLPFSVNEFLHDSFSFFRTECGISIHRCHEDRGISVVLRLFARHSGYINVDIACESDLMT